VEGSSTEVDAQEQQRALLHATSMRNNGYDAYAVADGDEIDAEEEKRYAR
jgi:hypothetical protein